MADTILDFEVLRERAKRNRDSPLVRVVLYDFAGST